MPSQHNYTCTASPFVAGLNVSIKEVLPLWETIHAKDDLPRTHQNR
jgi:hypothetical protein